MDEKIRTLVVYAAKNGRQTQVPVEVSGGGTVRDAIKRSGLLTQFPEIDLDNLNRVGSYGKFLTLDTVVEEGMRLEIYRSITVDPATVPRRPVAKPTAKG